MTDDMNSNQMEPFNGNTVRLREEATRGLKREDPAILTGLRLYHNFVRPHLGLPGNITPGEAAGIRIDGDNKWKTIIQNAAKQRDAESKQAGEDRQAGNGGQSYTYIRADRSHGRWSAGVRMARSTRHSRLVDFWQTWVRDLRCRIRQIATAHASGAQFYIPTGIVRSGHAVGILAVCQAPNFTVPPRLQ